MSFIKKDFNLQEELIRIAQGVPQADQALNSLVLQGLVNKLENDLYSAPSGADVSPFSAGRENTQLFPKDLTNPNEFMSFLSRNKITYNGVQLAYDHKGADDVDFQQLSSRIKTDFFKYPKPLDAAKNDFQFWVNKNAVTEFLKLQLVEAKQNANELHTLYINKLIQQVKNLSGEDLNPKGIEDKQVVGLNNSTVIDGFENKNFLPKIVPNSNRGNIPLTYGDISSFQSLNAWLDKGPKATIISVDEDGSKSSSNWDDPDANRCVIINTLYARAKYYKQISKSKEETDRFAAYMTKIQEISGNFSGPNGACSISDTAGQSSVSETKQTKPGTTKQSLEATIPYVIGSLPLRRGSVNFARIRKFLEYIEQIMPNETATYKPRIEASMNTADSYTNEKGLLNLSQNAEQIKRSLNNPGSYCMYMANMHNVVSATQMLILAFKDAFGDEMSAKVDKADIPILKRPENKAWYDAVLSQVGGHANDTYSIAFENISQIDYLRKSGNCPF